MERKKIVIILDELRNNLNSYIDTNKLSKKFGYDSRTIQSYINLLEEIKVLRLWNPRLIDDVAPEWCPSCGSTNRKILHEEFLKRIRK